MPDPGPLDILPFLTPIREDSPSGESLRWEDEYAELQSAMEEEEDAASTGEWRRERKKANWHAVIDLGTQALREKTKDLQIAAWVAEGLARTRGLAGLRDGLRLILALQDAFWATAHPDPSDPEVREGIYLYLDVPKRFPLLIRNVALTQVVGHPSYSYLKFKESRETENILRKDPEKEDALKAEGRIRAEDFDKLSDATDRPFLESVVGLLGECREAVRQLNDSLRDERHLGKSAPTLSKTETALDEVAKLAGQLLARKPAPEPPPVEPDDPDPGLDPDGGSAPDDDEQDVPPPPPRAAARPRAVAAPSGPEQARAMIVGAAEHLREADGSDPTPYLVVRALRMGELYRLADPPDPALLPPPTSEDRQGLRSMAAEGDWDGLLARAEAILAGPQGAGWLDARRHALAAMAALGHADAERAARAVLGAELRDFPGWPEAELGDGTPTANAETRAWIKQAFPPPGPPTSPAYQPPPPAADPAPTAGPGGEPDPWDRVQELLAEGRPAEAVGLIARAAREARTGRERFLRTLQQAEVCLSLGRPGVATPLLEGLARQIDELGLDRWEDPALCARVVAALYGCLRGKDPARARSAYERLCQLDIGLALGLGEGPDA